MVLWLDGIPSLPPISPVPQFFCASGDGLAVCFSFRRRLSRTSLRHPQRTLLPAIHLPTHDFCGDTAATPQVPVSFIQRPGTNRNSMLRFMPTCSNTDAFLHKILDTPLNTGVVSAYRDMYKNRIRNYRMTRVVCVFHMKWGFSRISARRPCPHAAPASSVSQLEIYFSLTLEP